MKCDEFEARLNLVLDERRRPEWDDELREHSAGCAGCRDLAMAYGLLFDGFYALKTPEPSADLSQRVLEEFQVRPAGGRRWALASAALATAAAVAIAAYLPWRTADEPIAAIAQATAPKVHVAAKPAPQVASHTAKSVGTEPVKFDWQDLGDLPLVGPALVSMSDNDKQTDPYAALAKGTGQGLASVVLSMPGMGRPGSVWPAQVSEEFRPVTESVTETFNLLLRSFPLTPAAPAPDRAS